MFCVLLRGFDFPLIVSVCPSDSDSNGKLSFSSLSLNKVNRLSELVKLTIREIALCHMPANTAIEFLCELILLPKWNHKLR